MGGSLPIDGLMKAAVLHHRSNAFGLSGEIPACLPVRGAQSDFGCHFRCHRASYDGQLSIEARGLVDGMEAQICSRVKSLYLGKRHIVKLSCYV